MGKGFASSKGTRGAEFVRVPARLDLELVLRGDVGVEGSGFELRDFSRPEADCVRFDLEPCAPGPKRVTSSMFTPPCTPYEVFDLMVRQKPCAAAALYDNLVDAHPVRSLPLSGSHSCCGSCAVPCCAIPSNTI